MGPAVPYAIGAKFGGLGRPGIALVGDGAMQMNGINELAADRPCVVEFLTDPAVPPIPPHATWDQLEKALESIVRGDSDRADVIKEGIKSKLQDFLPGSGRS